MKIYVKVWDVSMDWLCQFAALSSALQCAFFQDLKISYHANEATKRFKDPCMFCPEESTDQEGCAACDSYV